MIGRLALGLYAAATSAATPLIHWHLRRRAATGKEDRARLGERAGRAGLPRPPGPLVWLHAASVGEALSLLPLVEAIRAARPDLVLLVTTATVTSATLMSSRLPAGALHQFVPVDTPAAVRRFIAFWRPSVALWVESELWPNALGALRAPGIPVFLINGRMSERSFRRWSSMSGVARLVLRAFVSVLAQSDADAERFRALGARDVRCFGNLKLAAEPLPADEVALATLRSAFAERPRWVAASTHDGEEAIVGRVHRTLAVRHSGLITVIVPRHPQRGPSIAALLRSEGLATTLRSAADPVPHGEGVYVADTLGELGLWYRLCPIAFVGGTLIPHGGHNPIEPARLGGTVLAGPHMDNFRSMADDLEVRGLLKTVHSEPALAAAIEGLLNDPRRGLRSGGMEGGAGVIAAVLGAIAPSFPTRQRSHPPAGGN